MVKLLSVWIIVVGMGILGCDSPQPGSTAGSTDSMNITVYKSPTCGCCEKWIAHLEDSGFQVSAVDSTNMTDVKRKHGVRGELSSCHTALVDGYVIEGHVPAQDIIKLLQTRPDVVGLFVPGMPMGSPGMESPNPQRYVVLALDSAGNTSVFSQH